MTALPTTTRRLLAAVAAVAVLATGCATETVSDGLDVAEPAPTLPDEAGDPDLDTGDDADDGVLDAAPDDPHADDGDGDVSEPATPAGERPTVEPPAATPAATPAKKPVTEPAATPVAKPAPKPTPTPAPPPRPAPSDLPDGTYEGRLVRIDRQAVTVDLVQVLSGEAARQAAAEAGELPPDGTLPNDVYVKDLGKRVTVPVAGDGGFQIYDCSGGCELVGTTLDALVSGAAKPYGGANTHVTLRVDTGEVVSFVEIYLP
jgi:hypothetical protein